MKNLSTLLFVLLSFSAAAKIGIHIKPLAGIGLANMSNTGASTSNITSYKAELAAGIRLNNLIVETGVGYMKTGYDIDGLKYEMNLYTPGSTSRQLTYYNNTYIPLRVTYNIHISKRVSLLPSIGTGVCLNKRTTIKTYFVNGGEESLLHSRDYNVATTYLMGEASVYAGYALGNFTVVAGPAFKRMLTQLNGSYEAMPYQLTIDAGVSYQF